MIDTVSLVDFSGADINNYLMKLLNEKGYSFSTALEYEIVRDIKEKLCYVPLDLDAEMKKSDKEIEKLYELPDGQVIIIGKERFKTIEPFFQSTLNKEKNINFSVSEALFFSIQNNHQLADQFYSNIVLSGGSTMFDGFNQRVEKMINSDFELSTKINVIAPPNRKYSSWIGASIFSSLSTFQNMCITKEVYYEYGPSIILTKCF